MPHHYSPFWLAFCAGQLTLSPLWTERDDSTPELGPYDDEDMLIWLRRSNEEHCQIITSYTDRAQPRWVAA